MAIDRLTGERKTCNNIKVYSPTKGCHYTGAVTWEVRGKNNFLGKKNLNKKNKECKQNYQFNDRGYSFERNCEFVLAWKIEIAKCFECMISVLDIRWE